jgi:hypothetical protein
VKPAWLSPGFHRFKACIVVLPISRRVLSKANASAENAECTGRFG